MPNQEEAILKRIKPHSDEAEVSCLGAMILDKAAITTASEILISEDFYGSHHGIIFDSIIELNNEGKPIDEVTILDRLREKDVPPEIASPDFIANLLLAVPTSVNIRHYAQIVKDKAVLRRLIEANEAIANACYVGKEPLDMILNDAEKKIFNLVQHRDTGDFTPIHKVVASVLAKISAAGQLDGNVTGIPTGFTDLDYRTAGLQPSDLILIAARPSMGKTAFVLNLAQHMAFKKKKHVAIFSLEMSKDQLMNRMLSLESKVDAQKLRVGDLNEQDWEQLLEAGDIAADSHLYIDDTPGISINDLRSKCRKLKLEKGLDIIIIDYLQLMSGSGKSDSRQQEISEISRSLKAIAREVNVPVVALSQLSRAVEQRPDHRPMLSDLRESGAIEQDADVVMFLYRDDYYHKDTELKNVAEVIIAKQRNGPIGTVQLAWIPQYTMFKNLQTEKHNN